MTRREAPAEEAFTFGCAGDALMGILHRPAEQAAKPDARPGVIVIVGGPQYRAGSHRQFVHLARALAGAGYPVLRFDMRGMGDSPGEPRGFEDVSDDIAAAIDELQARTPETQGVVLWGLCDGASAALLYLHDRPDARVRGLCLLNPWVRSHTTLARTHVKHYYLRRLGQRAFWAKLVRGGVATTAVRGLLRNLAAAFGRRLPADHGTVSFQLKMAHAWTAFHGAVLLLLSGNDYTAREFGEYTAADRTWKQALLQRPPQILKLDDADHTLASAAWRGAAERAVIVWLRTL